MNDMEFIETLKEKRNACGYSQTRLAKELHISRQNLNEIENGKTRASREMKHTLLRYLDYCKCTQHFTLTVDYLRVRFPATDALEIIKNVLAMKIEYFIHEDYGLFGYEELYSYGEIIVMASKDASMGVLLELRGTGCRHLEYVLQARGISWYNFLNRCMYYQGIFKRLDLAANDMYGLLDIEILRERYYANKVWKRSRNHEAVDSGKLSGTKGDTAKTFYIGSKNSPLYFCLYEKEKEQKNKGIHTDIKNRFEIRLKNDKAGQAVEELVFSKNPEQTIASLILMQIDFPNYILWDIFIENITASLPFIMTPVAVNMDKTIRWLERQVMPSLLMIEEIERQTGANYLEEIDRHTRLTDKQEMKIRQMTTDIADVIED
ncbi:TPA: XRE family transcriptional regulator [Clostridioides difficile]|uniref:XRE family transcriptional regulator n=1 Tax=Clostridioides difficile TaxID=1496 RepID=UPI00098003C8|nr:XRE family transcriptional regulator [Clostridioides difficile]SJR01382.1 Plasmid maintenance system antidote protein [Clostridioides difficile]HBF0728208.1 XRE family transcriptional regulator [Clostridioides difficile]HBF6040575.1 XRE family transcriptional regulator [Clostridioides difficile]HBF7388415.1 XRE family transcriptional regulator [Clostridioides difficile]HBG3349681.1 XRE family transcriptional regulator [Clostridioides difficile]